MWSYPAEHRGIAPAMTRPSKAHPAAKRGPCSQRPDTPRRGPRPRFFSPTFSTRFDRGNLRRTRPCLFPLRLAAMLYDISLNIEYLYDNSAGSSRHVVRLMPADLARRATARDRQCQHDADTGSGRDRALHRFLRQWRGGRSSFYRAPHDTIRLFGDGACRAARCSHRASMSRYVAVRTSTGSALSARTCGR